MQSKKEQLSRKSCFLWIFRIYNEPISSLLLLCSLAHNSLTGFATAFMGGYFKNCGKSNKYVDYSRNCCVLTTENISNVPVQHPHKQPIYTPNNDEGKGDEVGKIHYHRFFLTSNKKTDWLIALPFSNYFGI